VKEVKKITERKLTQVSQSLTMTLPMPFVKKHNLKQIEDPIVIAKINNDWSLTVIPKVPFKEIPEEITIEVYREVAREVVEKILSGAAEIHILSDKEIPSKIRAEIQIFVDRLPQAKIIEETKQRITIQNFGFENVPGRKMLHRLISLVSELFKNVRMGNDTEINRNFRDLKEFYIILNGYIRKFHSTGFLGIDDDMFTQKKASDYRIFSYQLKIVAYILKDFEYDEKIQDFYMKVEGYFSNIFDAFRKKDEKLAHQLWFEHRPLENEGENIILNSPRDLKYKIKFLLMILKIFRSMTALIYS
jgi:hypothetical protein